MGGRFALGKEIRTMFPHRRSMLISKGLAARAVESAVQGNLLEAFR
jgi:hypothetical protein